MDINDAITRLKSLAAGLPKIIELNLETAAISSFALVERRLIETGKDSKGKEFEDYSDTYKKRKEKKGKYSGHVDFKFSGNMLNSIGLAERKKSDGKFAVVITGRDGETLIKMEKNAELRPGFLDSSKSEIQDISDSFKTETVKGINKYFS